MDQLNKIITVKKNTTDLTSLAYNPQNENISLSLVTSDFVFISYRKPVKQLYIDFQVGNTANATLKLECSADGSTGWTELTILDETRGFSRSGYIFINDTKTTYYRLSLNANSSAMKIRSISTQLCSEYDMVVAYPGITRFYPRDYNSHILALEEATRSIVELINSKGGYKFNGTDVSLLNRYDFFNINEIRKAATYKALAIAMGSLTDNPNDNYKVLSDKFDALFDQYFTAFTGGFLSRDTNDNGEFDDEDKAVAIQVVRFVR